MSYDINSIFQIAGIGIVIAMIHTMLKQMGKEDVAQWVSVIGFILILLMVMRYLNDLFQQVKNVYRDWETQQLS